MFKELPLTYLQPVRQHWTSAAAKCTMSNMMEPPSIRPVPDEGLVRLTHLIYALHAFSAIMGVISPAAVVTAFLTGWPSIFAVVLNYVKRSDVRGTYLESHFSWQIRTFWYALVWVIVAAVLFVTVIGIPLAWLIIVVVGIWVLYRIMRGWLALNDRRAVGS